MKDAPLDPSHLDALKDIIRTRYGLIFPPSRLHDLEAGIRRTMADEGSSDPDRFVQLIEADDRVADAMIARITVRETYFFREPKQFDALRDRVLPDLKARFAGGEKMRIWSAGCATGEEPYSIAILLEQEGLAGGADILGTDISRPSLELAKKASYSSWSLRGDTQAIASRYFERQQQHFVLREQLRNRVSFRKLNLASESYPDSATGIAEMDLILCRNVLIYFDEETIRHVARQLFQSLRPGGWLIMGPSDPPLWDHAPYQTHTTPAGILYRRADAGEPQRQHIKPISKPWQEETPPHRATTPPQAQRAAPPPQKNAARAPAKGASLQKTTNSAPGLAALTTELRNVANRGAPLQAETMAAAALRTHPLSPELHFLHAITLMELARHGDAAAALRRVIYLDPNLALAHFMLGSVLQRLGATADARRTYRNVLTLCRAHSTDEIVPLSQGERFAALQEAAQAQISQLNDSLERAR